MEGLAASLHLPVTDVLVGVSTGTDEASRAATTSLLTMRLRAGDLAGAGAALERLRTGFEGPAQGLDREGHVVPGAILAGAVVDEATSAARSAVEGATPSAEKAKAALAVAGHAAESLEPDAEEREALRLAEAYVARLGAPLTLAEVAPGAAPPSGPSIVAFATDFDLGEPVLPSVLRRWSKGLPVRVVGRITGKVRPVGSVRRVAASREAEETAIRARFGAGGPTVLAFGEAGGTAERALGVAAKGATVFVLDERGVVVATGSGPALDPRTLDPVVVRLGGEAVRPPR
jgi:hypothetical protein